MTLVSMPVRSFLLVLPTVSGDALAAACNRGLDDVVNAIGIGGPPIKAVDPDDSSVTIASTEMALAGGK